MVEFLVLKLFYGCWERVVIVLEIYRSVVWSALESDCIHTMFDIQKDIDQIASHDFRLRSDILIDNLSGC